MLQCVIPNTLNPIPVSYFSAQFWFFVTIKCPSVLLMLVLLEQFLYGLPRAEKTFSISYLQIFHFSSYR